MKVEERSVSFNMFTVLKLNLLKFKLLLPKQFPTTTLLGKYICIISTEFLGDVVSRANKSYILMSFLTGTDLVDL